MIVLVIFGIMTGLMASDMEANLPTPTMGVWERINIGVYMVWVIVLAMLILKKENPPGMH